MAREALVFEVSESGFEKYVIENSHKVPVLVEFMAVWSEHCVLMADVLGSLAEEFAEEFVFAKLDIDESTGLRDRFEIKNVPTLVVFRNGQVELKQEGQLQEEELRVLLSGLGVYRESDEMRLKARKKHMNGETPEAIMLLTEAIKKDPSNTRVAMDMVQIFIDAGELEQAKGLFEKLPEVDQQSQTGKSLSGQLVFSALAANTEGLDSLAARVAADEEDHDARFDLAVCMIANHDYMGAVDHMFTLLEKESNYKEGAPKEMIITMANMLAPNEPELAKSIRQRLGKFLN